MTGGYGALFGLSLRAFPAPFRARFGDDMRAAFEDACEDRSTQPLRLLGFALHTIMGMVWAGLKERVSPTVRASATAPPAGRWSAMQMSRLDFRLGLRMLVKSPGLTLVAVFSLAIGIPVGLTPNHLVDSLEAPLPVPEGEQIRLLRNWNRATSEREVTTSWELERWRSGLTTFEALGAVRPLRYNISADDALAPPVLGAEVTASTFDILRVRPLLGRALGIADEVPGGAPVVVIGYDLWQSRLGGDPGVIGQDLDIGGDPHTIVGVMPKGYLFPTQNHLWLPLREQAAGEPGVGNPLIIFGRLPDGASDDAAQAELTALGQRAALEFPETHTRLQAEVVPFAYLVFNGPRGGIRAMPEFYISQIITLILLLVACSNVAMLIFARTAARSQEMAVRTALGASRSRIVGQIFTESLVPAVLAAGVGLLLIDWLPPRLIAIPAAGRQLPYWIDLGVGPSTVVWAMVLAVFSAAVVGIIPALRVTGRSVQRNIQRSQANRSGVRFGGASGVLIVADVAVAVITVGLCVGLSHQVNKSFGNGATAGIEAEQFLSAQLRFADAGIGTPDDEVARLDLALRATEGRRALVERLEAEPGVRGVAVATSLPRMDHPSRFIEVEGQEPPGAEEPPRVRVARADQNFFNALGQPILSGRGFNSADLEDGTGAVIVNTPFVEQVLGGRNPIGRRIRYTMRSGEAEPGPWYEVVGVVGQLGMNLINVEKSAGVYHPLGIGSEAVYLAIHLGDNPEAFIPRLRAIANEIDPNASIGSPQALSRVFQGDWYLMVGLTLAAVALVALLLALAASGIYAIMSFAVAEREREIGIRAALGANQRQIAMTVARRALFQIGLGALIGTPVAGVVFFEMRADAGANLSGLLVFGAALIPGLLVMVLVGLVACTGPTLRALRVEPTEALRS